LTSITGTVRMTQSFLGRRGIAVAPHSLACEAALRVLRDGVVGAF
jgi:hypothetical protein